MCYKYNIRTHNQREVMQAFTLRAYNIQGKEGTA